MASEWKTAPVYVNVTMSDGTVLRYVNEANVPDVDDVCEGGLAWDVVPRVTSEAVDEEWEALVAAAGSAQVKGDWQLGCDTPLPLAEYLDWSLWAMKLADDLTQTFSQEDIAKLRDWAEHDIASACAATEARPMPREHTLADAIHGWMMQHLAALDAIDSVATVAAFRDRASALQASDPAATVPAEDLAETATGLFVRKARAIMERIVRGEWACEVACDLVNACNECLALWAETVCYGLLGEGEPPGPTDTELFKALRELARRWQHERDFVYVRGIAGRHLVADCGDELAGVLLAAAQGGGTDE